jgi:hypothetical protein
MPFLIICCRDRLPARGNLVHEVGQSVNGAGTLLFLEHEPISLATMSLGRKDADDPIQGFYNPVNDSFIEPSHTGISYSFTADGFFESAYYRAVSNRMWTLRRRGRRNN